MVVVRCVFLCTIVYLFIRWKRASARNVRTIDRAGNFPRERERETAVKLGINMDMKYRLYMYTVKSGDGENDVDLISD